MLECTYSMCCSRMNFWNVSPWFMHVAYNKIILSYKISFCWQKSFLSLRNAFFFAIWYLEIQYGLTQQTFIVSFQFMKQNLILYATSFNIFIYINKWQPKKKKCLQKDKKDFYVYKKISLWQKYFYVHTKISLFTMRAHLKPSQNY